MAQAGFGQASLVPHTLFRELNKPPCQFTAAAIAQGNAAAQNEAMFAATIERGQQNMAQLEQAVIKDNTLLPGECMAASCIWRRRPIRAAAQKPIRS
jgi:hypothetical protein